MSTNLREQAGTGEGGTGGRKAIDLNADLGEGEATDAELMALVSSCNVACGGHIGDADSIAATLRLAIRHGVVAGAHPSYPDPEGFGRRAGFASGDVLYESLTEQVTNFADIAARLGVRARHLKPHGALYNDAARDEALADIVARVASEAHPAMVLVGPPRSRLEAAAASHGLGFAAEGFVDRAYTREGALVPRTEPDAVHADVEHIAAQAVSLALKSRVTMADGTAVAIAVDTLCLHGDTPNAVAAARAVRRALEKADIRIRALAQPDG